MKYVGCWIRLDATQIDAFPLLAITMPLLCRSLDGVTSAMNA